LNPSYALALKAAEQATGHQEFPLSSLYVVATPIGNMADITLRALHTLSICDFLACEDTRDTKNLLKNYGIDKPAEAWVAVHQHNESEISPLIINKLAQGARIAFLCDAGTPGISDPGAWLVHSVSIAGFKVVPIPGVSSVTTLISASGLIGISGFIFFGFLSTKSIEREKQIKSFALDPRPTVILEAPHRIEALTKALSLLGERKVTLGRELTKQFEQIITLPANLLHSWLLEDQNHQRGEFVVIVHANDSDTTEPSTSYEDILRILLSELSVKGSVKLAQLLTGAPKNELYELALTLNTKNQM